MISIISKIGCLENTTFISFSWENCVDIKDILPNQKVQFLCSKLESVNIPELKKYGIDLDINYNEVTKELVDSLHENGIEINCWTVDDPNRAEELAAFGVDYITSNILE